MRQPPVAEDSPADKQQENKEEGCSKPINTAWNLDTCFLSS